MTLQPLESRLPTAADFQNAFNRFDVDDDAYLTPGDALAIVNEINSHGARPLTLAGPAPGLQVDVNGDSFLASADALQVINRLNLAADTSAAPLALAGSLSPESDPDGNSVVLRGTVTFVGQTAAGASIRIRGEGFSPRVVTADAQGQFQAALELPPGLTLLQVQVADHLGRGTQMRREVRFGDVVLNWNASLLNVIRDWTTLSNDPYPNRIVPERPPVAARNLAMMHAAMFDAVNAVTGGYQAYQVHLPAPAGASAVAAAAAAAHRVASQLYSAADEVALLDAALNESLATVPDGAGKVAGIDLGRQVGNAILAWRSNDGSRGTSSYVPGSDPGDWNRTFPDYLPPLLPQWPHVAPFAMTSSAQFRAPPPPALGSPEYAAAVDEVLQLGSLSSTARTPDQTEIALFWADGGGTFTPPGHWNHIANNLALTRGQTLLENARLFALLNIALADAGISSWDTKYAYDLWRPIDAIRRAQADGNAATTSDATWTPLLKTPPFPTYTSGHSTFSGAADAVLTALFGENVPFTTSADDHNSFSQRPLADSQLTTRSFPSFTAAAEEAGRSRIYGGIHFEFDNQAGLAAGRAVGRFVLDTLLKPRPAAS